MNILKCVLNVSTLGSIFAICLAASPGWAADGPAVPRVVPTEPAAQTGTVNAASLRPFPNETVVSVLAWDNSDENTDLARYIVELLGQRGFRVADDAPLALKFTTTENVGQLSENERSRLVDIYGKAGTGTEDEARVRLNLFSSDKGGVFNEGRTVTSESKVFSTYSLEMTIDRRDGPRLWQGEARVQINSAARQKIARQLVPPLLANIGKTVRAQSFGVK